MLYVNELSTPMEQIDKVIELNNQELLKTKKVYEVPVKDAKTGEIKYSVNYVAEPWKMIRKKNERTKEYTVYLEKTISNSNGFTYTFRIRLNDDDMQYLNYFKKDALIPLYTAGSMTIPVKTRFVYGVHAVYNSVYISLQILLADKRRKSLMLNDGQLEVLFDAMSNEKTTFNVVMQKKLQLEDDPDDDLETL